MGWEEKSFVVGREERKNALGWGQIQNIYRRPGKMA